MATFRSLMAEAHPEYLGWQVDWPLYVRVPMLKIKNKVFKKNDHFPWAEMGADPKKVAQLYKQRMVHHNATLTTERGEGDRLGEMSIRGLRSLAQMLNTKLKKEHVSSEEEFKRKRCRMSASNADTQRRYIRQFLNKNPYMGDYFLEIRDQFIVKVVEKPQEEEKTSEED